METSNQIWRPYDDVIQPTMDNTKFKHLNTDTFKHVTDEKFKAVGEHIGNTIGAVAYLSDFTAEHDVFEFPLNDDGLPYIEQYLLEMVKPYILKWGGKHGLEPTIKHAQSLKPEPKVSIASRLHLAQLVLGQCLAQQHNLFWTPDGAALMKDPANPDDYVGVWGKVRKFLKYGAEDGFKGFSTFIANRAANQYFVKAAMDLFKQQGKTFPNGSIYQQWHDEAGQLIELKVLHPRTKRPLGSVRFMESEILAKLEKSGLLKAEPVGELKPGHVAVFSLEKANG